MNLKDNINTQEYWEYRMRNNWEQRGGNDQQMTFMKAIVDEIPVEIKDDINGTSICDTNCAFGYSLPVLKETFTDSKITGVDFTEYSIEQAKIRHPEFEFKGDLSDKYDVTITSNSLEHMDDWQDVLNQYLDISNKYCVIMVPYNETILNREGEHVISFKEDSFADKLNGFEKIHCREIKTDWWLETQMVVIYKKVEAKKTGRKKV
jgi:trans-aconitate methyltransferase